MELDNYWLGLDPGLARIGWGVVAEDNDNHPHLVDYGTIQTSKNLPTPQRLVEIEQDLVELLKEFEPDYLSISFIKAKVVPDVLLAAYPNNNPQRQLLRAVVKRNYLYLRTQLLPV